VIDYLIKWLGVNKPFGGKTVLLGRDFRQIPPVLRFVWYLIVSLASAEVCMSLLPAGLQSPPPLPIAHASEDMQTSAEARRF